MVGLKQDGGLSTRKTLYKVYFEEPPKRIIHELIVEADDAADLVEVARIAIEKASSSINPIERKSCVKELISEIWKDFGDRWGIYRSDGFDWRVEKYVNKVLGEYCCGVGRVQSKVSKIQKNEEIANASENN